MIDITSGNHAKWYLEKRNTFKNPESNFAKRQSAIYTANKNELNAYGWEMKYGNYNLARGNYDYY